MNRDSTLYEKIISFSEGCEQTFDRIALIVDALATEHMKPDKDEIKIDGYIKSLLLLASYKLDTNARDFSLPDLDEVDDIIEDTPGTYTSLRDLALEVHLLKRAGEKNIEDIVIARRSIKNNLSWVKIMVDKIEDQVYSLKSVK